MGGLEEGPGRGQGVDPQDNSTAGIWRRDLTSIMVLAHPTQIFHHLTTIAPFEGLQLPGSGDSNALLEAQKPGYGDW